MIDIESTIKGVLESWGFSVEKIPESTRQGEQTPDFVVNDAESFYILEVKTREDDPAETAKRDETLQLGALFAEHIPLVRRNTLILCPELFAMHMTSLSQRTLTMAHSV